MPPLFSFFSVILWVLMASAEPIPADSNILVRDSLDSLLKQAPGRKSDYSVYVLDGHKEVYSLNAHQKRILASLSKIPTAAAVLKYLAPTTRFKTQLKGAGVLPDGVLKGDLYLKGGGDPGFVSETLWVLVNNFLRTGVREITGSIIVDDFLFDKIYISESRESVRVDRAYDAPVSAMSFNWNSVNVCVRPGLAVGEPAKVVLDPLNEYTRLQNLAKTTNQGAPLNIKVERKRIPDGGDLLEVSGFIPLNHPEKIIYKNISLPAYWSGYNLKAFLQQRNIKVSGEVKTGRAGEELSVLAEVESWPLSVLVADMMKFSSNYVAEMLTKHLSEPTPLRPGNLKDGVEKIRKFIVEAGVAPSTFVFNSPSGFSRENQMTAKDLAQILSYIRGDFRIFPEFLASLPVSGYDGTLKGRMTSPKVQGWIRAKTGMLNGVNGLAGFAGQKSGAILTFVFIYNGSADTFKVRDFFDKLAEALVP